MKYQHDHRANNADNREKGIDRNVLRPSRDSAEHTLQIQFKPRVKRISEHIQIGHWVRENKTNLFT